MSDYLPIPPTNAISDPQVRAVVEALRRNVEIAADTLTNLDVAGTTYDTLSNIFGAGSGAVALSAGTTGTGGSTNSVLSQYENLASSITNSLLFRKLGEQITIDLSKYSIDKFPSIAAALSTTNAAIISETTTRTSEVESVITTLTAQGVRLTSAESAITTETTTRVTKDNALAAAVNNMWAKIGGSTAAITDSQLASVTASAATATRWNSVVSAVTDPNTGQINSASIVQELDTYANSADSTFNSIYSVRAQTSVGGQTIVGGFGLAATAGAGSAQGSTIDFGVRADRFFVAATSSTPSLATQLNAAYNTVPFIVATSTQTVNGVTYQPGVYMKTAFIADATIDIAKITNTIQSDNYSPGVAGWFIRRSDGYAEFGNIFARGNIQATSLTANTVYTNNIVGSAVTGTYVSSTTGSTTSVTVNITDTVAAVIILVTLGSGLSYTSGENSTYDPVSANLTINGSPVVSYATSSIVYMAASPTPGTYVINVGRWSYSPSTMTLAVQVAKR